MNFKEFLIKNDFLRVMSYGIAHPLYKGILFEKILTKNITLYILYCKDEDILDITIRQDKLNKITIIYTDKIKINYDNFVLNYNKILRQLKLKSIL